MKPLILLLLALSTGSKTNAQHRKEMVKHILDSLTVNKDHIAELESENGTSKTVYTYSTIDNKIFWIEYTNKQGDKSITSDAFLFINDKIIGIRYYRHRLSIDVKNAFFYFENDRLVEQENRYRRFSEQEANELLKKGYAFLADGNERIRQKFRDQ